MVPFLTSWNVRILEKCPRCGALLTIKFTSEGIPFITCDSCSYKRELILFKPCPRCGGNMKFIHKHKKLKCEKCDSWYLIRVELEGKEKEGKQQTNYPVLTRTEIEKVVENYLDNKLKSKVVEIIRNLFEG